MRLLPGRGLIWLAVPAGVVVGAIATWQIPLVGVVVGAFFGVILAAVVLFADAGEDTRLLRLLELLPQTIVVNVLLDSSSNRQVRHLGALTDSNRDRDASCSLAIDGEALSFWGGIRTPYRIARIPWEAVESLQVVTSPTPQMGSAALHLSTLSIFVRSADEVRSLTFWVPRLPEDGAGTAFYNEDELQRLVHYAKARRHGAMPPKPELPPSPPPMRTFGRLIVPIAIGVGILSVFAIVLFAAWPR